jgi:allantoinase
MNPWIRYRMTSERAPLPLLDGKRLIVQMALNVEYWAFERRMPRALLPAPAGGAPIPDVPNFSWVDYGMRAGMPRFLDAMRHLPVTVAINASVLQAYPSSAEAMLEAGWEFVGHGVDQVTMHTVDDEAAVVQEAYDLLERFSGKRPIGWLGPGLQMTAETPNVLAKAGAKYVLDWVIDDTPNWLETAHGPLASLPYNLELNDSLLHAVQQQPSDELLRRMERTLETFDRELDEQGGVKVLTIPLHPHLMGVPHRIGTLRRCIELLESRSDVVFVDGTRLFDWYASVEPFSAS